MRLTLRTLLAYLDGVLDRQDAKDLQEKVAQGRLAKGMVDRIQSVQSRPKLAAPKVDARGTAGDANVVAEYLDNTMQALHVAEFEQACLAEDARLAEVASCHQILTMVLAKPAMVSSDLRNRIRQLGNADSVLAGEKSAKAGGGSGVLESLRSSVLERNGKRIRIDQNHRGSAASNDDGHTSPERAIPAVGLELDDKLISQVPEYLKSGSSGHWSNTLTILGLLAALFFVAWLSLGSLDDVRSLLYQNTQTEQPSHDPSVTLPAIDVPSTEVAASSTSPILETHSAPPGPTVEAIAPPMIPEVNPKVESEPNAARPTVDAPTEIVPPTNERPISEPPTIEPPSLVEPPVAIESSSKTPFADSNPTIHWQPETKESAMALVFAKREAKGSAPTIRQLANGEALSRDERLVVPPAFRTELKIAPGIRWVVSDESVMESITTEAADSAAVRLRLGRALVHATPDCQKLDLKTPIDSISIRMKDASSIVAIEVRYKRVVGCTVEQAVERVSTSPIGMMQPALSLVCVAGEAIVVCPNDEPLSLEVGQGFEWTIGTPARPMLINEVPWWYRTSVQRPIDAEAAIDLTNRMSDESTTDKKEAKSIMDLLLASIDSRRSETAALALRSMFLLDEYSKCVGSDSLLSNPASRPHRSVILDSFYQSLGANEQGVIHVKEAIEATDMPRSARLIGLLSLPDNSQLSEGQDRVLVESLSSPFIDERILAIYQLSAILGKEHGFQSDRPSVDSIQQWKRLLNSTKIRWSK